MAKGTDRQTAQDRTLNMFRRTIQSSGSFENKPLSLAEQLAQLDNQPTKRTLGSNDEMENRVNDPQLVKFRSPK